MRKFVMMAFAALALALAAPVTASASIAPAAQGIAGQAVPVSAPASAEQKTDDFTGCRCYRRYSYVRYYYPRYRYVRYTYRYRVVYRW